MPGQFQGSGLGVSSLPCCCGRMGLQQEHLPWGEAAAGGGGGRNGQQCFEPGRFLGNLAQVSLEEVNKLLVRIFSGVLQLLSQEHPSGSSALVSTAAPLVWPAQAPPALGEAGEQQRVMGTARVLGQQRPGVGQAAPQPCAHLC